MKMVIGREDDWLDRISADPISGKRMNEAFKSLYLCAVGNG